MSVKIAAVKVNDKLGLVQIKTNKGPNTVLDGELALGFKARRNSLVNIGCTVSEANVKAALEYLEVMK